MAESITDTQPHQTEHDVHLFSPDDIEGIERRLGRPLNEQERFMLCGDDRLAAPWAHVEYVEIFTINSRETIRDYDPVRPQPRRIVTGRTLRRFFDRSATLVAEDRCASRARPSTRRRGTGSRPATTRGAAKRSNQRSGDSGDDGSGSSEPSGHSSGRRCRVCGEPLPAESNSNAIKCPPGTDCYEERRQRTRAKAEAKRKAKRDAAKPKLTGLQARREKQRKRDEAATALAERRQVDEYARAAKGDLVGIVANLLCACQSPVVLARETPTRPPRCLCGRYIVANPEKPNDRRYERLLRKQWPSLGAAITQALSLREQRMKSLRDGSDSQTGGMGVAA